MSKSHVIHFHSDPWSRFGWLRVESNPIVWNRLMPYNISSVSMVKKQSGLFFQRFMCEMPTLADILGSAWRRLSQEEGQEFGTKPVPPAAAVWGSSALQVTHMLRPQMLRRPMWRTCVCMHSVCAYIRGPKQGKGRLCESTQAQRWLHKCHCKKVGKPVSCFLTGSTLNVFHLQMWTGALPPRRWPTTRRSRTACSSVVSPTTWKPSGKKKTMPVLLFGDSPKMSWKKRPSFSTSFKSPLQELVTVHFLLCCLISF